MTVQARSWNHADPLVEVACYRAELNVSSRSLSAKLLFRSV